MLEYKGFAAVMEIAGGRGNIFGHVIGTTDQITFQADTVDEARREFVTSVEDYLAFCKELGKEPDRSFSGKLPMHLNPELHRALAIAAEARKESITEIVRAACELALERWQIPIEELAGSTVEIGEPAEASAPVAAKPPRKSTKRKPAMPAAAAKE